MHPPTYLYLLFTLLSLLVRPCLPAYMAPELFENRSFNKSVDAFAFGVLTWEVFTGEVPFYMLDVSDIR